VSSFDSRSVPTLLRPTSLESFALTDRTVVQIAKATPKFTPWLGPAPGDTYGKKPLLEIDGQPAFAELVILRLLQGAGWEGVWVDTYRNKFRQGYWDIPPVPFLPSHPQNVLTSILNRRGAGRSGTWDVLCWRGSKVLFVESKRRGKDSIRPEQITFLETALTLDIPASSFLVVEWS